MLRVYKGWFRCFFTIQNELIQLPRFLTSIGGYLLVCRKRQFYRCKRKSKQGGRDLKIKRGPDMHHFCEQSPSRVLKTRSVVCYILSNIEQRDWNELKGPPSIPLPSFGRNIYIYMNKRPPMCRWYKLLSQLQPFPPWSQAGFRNFMIF